MPLHIHTRRGRTAVGAIVGAIVLTATVAPWAQPAAATMGRSPMLEPPVLMGDPPLSPLMDAPVQPDPGAPVGGLLAQVQHLVNALVPPCVLPDVPPDVPPDQSDPTTVDTASTTSTTQPCTVVVARNVESPGAVAVASQSQDAPVTQAPDPTEVEASD